MKQEASMGRRPITRADEGEVRRRVAPRGYTVAVDNGEDGHVWIAGFWGDGPDGWEIEDARPVAVRRKLPAPWAWWSCDAPRFAHLSQTGKLDDCVAQAWPNEAIIYHKGYRKGIDSRFDAASLEAARERAEDECWARGLFGVSDAPPVDREQAIRDALIERLTCSPLPTDVGLLNLLNGGGGRPMATSQEITDALVSIGAVRDGGSWRLSDGPPPGWEWRQHTSGTWYLARVGVANYVAASIAGVDPLSWEATDAGMFGKVYAKGGCADVAEGQAAALLACRKAGLFAPSEPAIADPPQWSEATIGGVKIPRNAPADPAARMLARLFALARGEDEHGTIAPSPGETAAQRAAQIGRLCDAFVAELRAPRREDQRGGSAVLVDYLTEHHRDTWHAGETAAAFAVRLLRSADDTIETLRREAEGADAARSIVAKERDAALDEVRAGRELSAREALKSERTIAGLVVELGNVKLARSAAESGCVEARAARDRAVVEVGVSREEARRLREQVGTLDRELASAREGARGLGVTCQAAQEARDVYQKRAEAAEGKLVYARGEIEAMAAQVGRLEQLLSPKVDA